jgi:hypothetical protein
MSFIIGWQGGKLRGMCREPTIYSEEHCPGTRNECRGIRSWSLGWNRKEVLLTCQQAGDLEVVSRELVNRLDEWNVMFYGKLPFVFAYATGGMKIRFYLLTPHKECISVFSSPLNAGILTHRLL